jgi:hypothetical protein
MYNTKTPGASGNVGTTPSTCARAFGLACIAQPAVPGIDRVLPKAPPQERCGESTSDVIRVGVFFAGVAAVVMLPRRGRRFVTDGVRGRRPPPSGMTRGRRRRRSVIPGRESVRMRLQMRVRVRVGRIVLGRHRWIEISCCCCCSSCCCRRRNARTDDGMMERAGGGPGSGLARHRPQRRRMRMTMMMIRVRMVMMMTRSVAHPETRRLRGDLVGKGRCHRGHRERRGVGRGGAAHHKRRPRGIRRSWVPSGPRGSRRPARSNGHRRRAERVLVLVKVRLVFGLAGLPGALALAPAAANVPAQVSIHPDEERVVVRVPIWSPAAKHEVKNVVSMSSRKTRSKSWFALTRAWRGENDRRRSEIE